MTRPHVYRYKVDGRLYFLEERPMTYGKPVYAMDYETGEYYPARKNAKKGQFKNFNGMEDQFEEVREF
jgi:hypothetical protein